MRPFIASVLALFAWLAAGDVRAQPRSPMGHSIYMTAVEFKGSTTADKVLPPEIDPGRLSRGYAYKGPGQADPADPTRWEVASYQFSPAFAIVRQGDSIILSVFIANGDYHAVELVDPDGERVIDKRTWDRSREYTLFFQVQKVGAYRLNCGTHAPSMAATILVLPR